MKFTPFLITWIVFTTLSLSADPSSDPGADTHLLFLEATGKLKDDPPLYTYRVVTTNDEKIIVEVFDPLREEQEQWQLKLADGEEPSKKQISKHAKQKAQQRERRSNRGFQQMVVPSSVRMLDENEDEITFQFQPDVFEDNPENNEKFVGLVIIRKQDATIRQMEYYNTADVKPVDIVTVEKMHTVVEFQSTPSGDQVPERSTTHTKGKVFGFKKFEEKYVQEFSDYRKVIGVD